MQKWREEKNEIRYKEERKKVKSLSRVRIFEISWTVAHQAPQSVEFSRQEYWSGLPFPPPGDLLDPGVKPTFLLSPALSPALPGTMHHHK